MNDEIRVTQHALLRYQERVERVSLREARKRIMACERAIRSAAAIGCTRVKMMPTRAMLILCGLTVVTVGEPRARLKGATGNRINGRPQRRRKCPSSSVYTDRPDQNQHDDLN